MSIPAGRSDRNIRLSLNKHVKDTFEVPNSLTGNVNYQYSDFSSSGKDKWVDIQFLSHGAGRRGVTLVQVDVYSRVKGKVADGDRYEEERDQLAELLHAAMHVDGIPLYDFAVPASPALLTGKLVVLNGDGTFREPDEDRVWPIEDGVARRTTTYRFRTMGDLAHARSYYD